jgi:hypothetical protein
MIAGCLANQPNSTPNRCPSILFGDQKADTPATAVGSSSRFLPKQLAAHHESR